MRCYLAVARPGVGADVAGEEAVVVDVHPAEDLPFRGSECPWAHGYVRRVEAPPGEVEADIALGRRDGEHLPRGLLDNRDDGLAAEPALLERVQAGADARVAAEAVAAGRDMARVFDFRVADKTLIIVLRTSIVVLGHEFV